MAHNYIPNSDTDLQQWVINFFNYATVHLADLGMVAGDLTPMTDASETFNAAVQDNTAKQAAAEAATQAKRDARAALESEIRELVGRLQRSAAVSDEERRALSIPVHDRQPTRVAVPDSAPVIQLRIAGPLRVEASFAVAGDPTSMAKPPGVHHINFLVFYGDTPPVPGDPRWIYVASDTATPYLFAFDPTKAGERVWVIGCWVNTRMEAGPYSAAVSVIVPG